MEDEPACENVENAYFTPVIEATSTGMARNFHAFLGKVEHGETVVIRKHGRAVARLVPDSEFMSGQKAADLFRSHKGDAETADAVETEIKKLDQEADHALAH